MEVLLSRSFTVPKPQIFYVFCLNEDPARHAVTVLLTTFAIVRLNDRQYEKFFLTSKILKFVLRWWPIPPVRDTANIVLTLVEKHEFYLKANNGAFLVSHPHIKQGLYIRISPVDNQQEPFMFLLSRLLKWTSGSACSDPESHYLLSFSDFPMTMTICNPPLFSQPQA